MLKKMNDKIYETMGTLIGFAASAFIIVQIIAEWKTEIKSSMSPIFILGFLFVYIFWFLYGVKFKRIALWLTNLVASALQLVLFVVVLLKY